LCKPSGVKSARTKKKRGIIMKMDTWTITVNLTVFAGDMSKEEVIENAETILSDITDGTDFAGFCIMDAKRDEY